MRPVYHFTPPQNFMNDPNGLVYFDGEYHLFYQHNPYGDTWGHMSWGHAVSKDGFHWEHLPIALFEQDGVMIFSGSAVVDWHNTSGFGDGRIPPMIAIYTGHQFETGDQPQRQSQCIAYSLDRGRSWTKYAGNPVLDIGMADFRDPKVFWHEAKKRWVMIVARSIENGISLYTSPDLKTWTHLSDFGPAGLDEGIWECPDLFELPIDGEAGTAWVLKVDSGPGWAFIGQFGSGTFKSELSPQRLDFGPDFYACQTWSDLPSGKDRLLLAWMTNWAYANTMPTSPWRGVMSIPRHLILRRTASGIHLYQKPIDTASIRTRTFQDNITINGTRKLDLAGDRLEIQAQITLKDALEAGFQVRQGIQQATTIGYDRERQELFVDRSKSGISDFHPDFASRYNAPVELVADTINLHILIDRCSVEVFAQDGERVISCLIFPNEESQAVSVYSLGGQAEFQYNAWILGEPDQEPINTQNSYDQVAAQYADKYFHELDQKPIDRQLLDRLIEWVGEFGPICDMGCGPGEVARYLKDHGAPDVLGVDLSPKMVATARKLSPDIPFYVNDMCLLTFPDASWGGLAAFYAIIHIPSEKLMDALNEYYRVLVPGGWVLVTFHIGDEVIHLDEWWDKPVNVDFIMLQPTQIETAIKSAGFKVFETVIREPYPEIESQTQRAYIFAQKPDDTGQTSFN